jgi:hypothetical protein
MIGSKWMISGPLLDGNTSSRGQLCMAQRAVQYRLLHPCIALQKPQFADKHMMTARAALERWLLARAICMSLDHAAAGNTDGVFFATYSFQHVTAFS